MWIRADLDPHHFCSERFSALMFKLTALHNTVHLIENIEWTRVVNFIKLGGGDPRCVQCIEQKDCTAGLDAGGYMRGSLLKT